MSLIKPESFVKYNNIKINTFLSNCIKDEKENVLKNLKYKKIKLENNKLTNNDFLKNQDYILDILIELRDYDKKNGTELFNNISYNNLKSLILKNSF